MCVYVYWSCCSRPEVLDKYCMDGAQEGDCKTRDLGVLGLTVI